MITVEQDPHDPARVRTVPFDVTVLRMDGALAVNPDSVRFVLGRAWTERQADARVVAGWEPTLLFVRPYEDQPGRWSVETVSLRDRCAAPGNLDPREGMPHESFTCPDGADPVAVFRDLNARSLDTLFLSGPDDPLLSAPAPSPVAIATMEARLDDILTVLAARQGRPIARRSTIMLALPERIPEPGCLRWTVNGIGWPGRADTRRRINARSGLAIPLIDQAQRLLDLVALRLGIGGCSTVPGAENGAPDSWMKFLLREHRAVFRIDRDLEPGLPSAQETAAARRRLSAIGVDPDMAPP